MLKGKIGQEGKIELHGCELEMQESEVDKEDKIDVPEGNIGQGD